MATWTAFYVRSSAESVARTCRAWYSDTLKRQAVESRGDFPTSFSVGFTAGVPRRLVLGQTHDEWCEVHYDRYWSPNELARHVSTTGPLVVDTVAQTTSGVCSLTVYEAGANRRILEFSDSEWMAQEGAPLPHEPATLTTSLAEEGEEPFDVFDVAAMARYCEQVFQFELWKDPSTTKEWIDVKLKRRGLLGLIGL